MVGTMIGTSIKTRTALLARLLTRQQPMAQSVPAVPAIAVEATAIIRLCQMLVSHARLVSRLR